MALKNLAKLKSNSNSSAGVQANPKDESTYNGPNRVIACLRGLGKILRGAVATLPGLVMGICGVGPKDSYEVVNAPVRDWGRLMKEKIKGVNQGRGWLERIGRGFLGIFTGAGMSVFNLVKDAFAGGFQLLFGGVWIVKKLKDLGLTPDVMDTILKTGNPLGYLIQASGVGVDKLNGILEKLHKDLSKYKSLGEMASKVRQELEQVPELKSIMDKVVGGADQLSEGLSAKFQEGFKQVGGNFENIKTAAQKAVSSGMDYKMQIAQLYESIIKDLPNIQRSLSQTLGIPKELIHADQNAVIVAGENSATAVKQLLADKSSNFSGVMVKASSKEAIMRKLIDQGDVDFVNKLAMVKIVSKGDGIERILPQHEITLMIKEATEKIKEVQAKASLKAADRAWDPTLHS